LRNQRAAQVADERHAAQDGFERFIKEHQERQVAFAVQERGLPEPPPMQLNLKAPRAAPLLAPDPRHWGQALEELQPAGRLQSRTSGNSLVSMEVAPSPRPQA
jgi:hypothetical protein